MQRDEMLSATEIAHLAGVTRAAVTNWRQRYDDFPARASRDGRSDLFRRDEVIAWLDQAGKLSTGDQVEKQIWALLSEGRDAGLAPGDVVELLANGPSEPSNSVESSAKALREWAQTTGSGAALAEGLAQLGFKRKTGLEFGEATQFQDFLSEALAQFADVGSIYDPAVGSGRLLRRAAKRVDASELYGQDINSATAKVARSLAQLEGIDVTIREGDSLRDCKFTGLQVDAVLSVPPFGTKLNEPLLEDPRWRYGVPQRDAFWAFAQDALHHLKPGGVAVLATSLSTLFGPGEHERFRERLTRDGVVKAVFRVGPGQLEVRGINPAVLVLRLPVRYGEGANQVLFGDFDESDNLMKSLGTAFAEESGAEHRSVAFEDIAANGFNLDPRRYCSADTPLPSDALRSINLKSVHSSLKYLTERPLIADRQPASYERTRLRDVVGLRLIHGSASRNLELAGSTRVLTLADLNRSSNAASWTDQQVREEKLTRQGDVAFAAAGAIGQGLVIDEDSVGCATHSRVWLLRSTGEQVEPEWIQLWLASTNFQDQAHRMSSGSTLPQLNGKQFLDFWIPLPPIDEQRVLTTELHKTKESLQQAEILRASLKTKLEFDISIAMGIEDVHRNYE